jgi:hypothetical protein
MLFLPPGAVHREAGRHGISLFGAVMDKRIEKFFTATDGNTERASQYGPFKTSGEAETAARQMGWGWVCVHTNTVVNEEPIDVRYRFYELPDEVDSLRRKIVRGNEAVVPMTENTRTFFEKYELQVEEGVSEVADLRSKAAGWTTDARMGAIFHRYGQR